MESDPMYLLFHFIGFILSSGISLQDFHWKELWFVGKHCFLSSEVRIVTKTLKVIIIPVRHLLGRHTSEREVESCTCGTAWVCFQLTYTAPCQPVPIRVPILNAIGSAVLEIWERPLHVRTCSSNPTVTHENTLPSECLHACEISAQSAK